MVMQNCRSKKKEEEVTYGFWLIVASLFVLFLNFFANNDIFFKVLVIFSTNLELFSKFFENCFKKILRC